MAWGQLLSLILARQHQKVADPWYRQSRYVLAHEHKKRTCELDLHIISLKAGCIAVQCRL